MNVSSVSLRRDFLKKSSLSLAGIFLPASFSKQALAKAVTPFKAKISAHLWVYASKHPPTWDATADLETIFSDLHLAGYDGLEVMDVILKHDDAVEHLSGLQKQYNLPVTGSSFGAAMWDTTKHDEILSDVTLPAGPRQKPNSMPRLKSCGALMSSAAIPGWLRICIITPMKWKTGCTI